eukprot:scaffold607_cov146-Skeletonema_dohrnii-CCMP3373.AAC.1
MQLRKATTFIVSTASFFLASNVAATSLRGVGEAVEFEDDILTEEKAGTFLLALVDYEDNSVHSGPEETFNVMVDNTIYEIDDADDDLKRLKSGEAVTIPVGTVLSSKSGKVETNGAKIMASKGGKKDGGSFKKTAKGLFKRDLEGRTEEQQRNVDQLRRHLVSVGDKSVVAVRVQTTDAVYGFSEAVLRREVFGIRGDTGQDDTLNLSSGYEQCSFGALTFTPLASETGNDGGDEVSIVDGVVTISVDVASNGISDSIVRNAVTDKIKAVFGSNMQAVADYWMYCLPPGTSGSWIAYAYINSYISVYNNQWCNYPSGQMHEIGHNLGYAHSGESQTYDDQSGMMGYSYSQDDGPEMCFNAAKSWQTGWYGESGTQEEDKTLEYSSGDGCLVKTISGIADYETTSNKVLIKIVNPSNNGADLFVAFNAKTGINSGTLEAGNQVTVVQVGSGGGEVYSESTLLAKLSAGGSYTTGSNFGGDLTVEVEGISASGTDYTADVKIYFGSECTVTPPPVPTPPPTPMPTKEGQSGPQMASYNAALGAPKCSFGSTCDSGNTLNGRGTMSGGNEPNQSNTLNSCTDGNSGSYHGDESIDKIVVSQESGSLNDFTEGDVVTISATVWCWSSGTSDFIDFYYASDASNPEWTQIGDRQTCPGGGQQTVSATYTLPEGSIQAVRANMMYGASSTAGAASCTSGSYDDTDDLVITVKPNQPVGPPTAPPTALPTANPTQNPTPQPSNAPTPVPSNPPTSQPTPVPTTPPTQNPTAQPTKNPTPQPSNAPTPVPSNPPTSQPTPVPTAPPTQNPTAQPTQNPTPQPTNPPVVGSTPPPTPVPTSAPSNPPTSPPTAQPTDVVTPSPTNNPTAPPTSSPTTSPGEVSKTLVCGRGDIEDKPCAEGLEGTALIDEIHEVRCCRDCTGISCSKPWKRKCGAFEPNLYARSKFAGVCKRGTFEEALDFCRRDSRTRLCTPLEVENSCAKGTGCNFDKQQVWACAYDGHACEADAECCGSCVNGTCAGEFDLFP